MLPRRGSIGHDQAGGLAAGFGVAGGGDEEREGELAGTVASSPLAPDAWPDGFLGVVPGLRMPSVSLESSVRGTNGLFLWSPEPAAGGVEAAIETPALFIPRRHSRRHSRRFFGERQPFWVAIQVEQVEQRAGARPGQDLSVAGSSGALAWRTSETATASRNCPAVRSSSPAPMQIVGHPAHGRVTGGEGREKPRADACQAGILTRAERQISGMADLVGWQGAGRGRTDQRQHCQPVGWRCQPVRIDPSPSEG